MASRLAGPSQAGSLLALSLLPLLSLLPFAAARAASFGISPMSFVLDAAHPAAVMQITNADDTPVRLQVQALAWTTDGKTEQLADTDDLLLNPPLFMLAPGAVQAVRFGLRRPETPTRERAYRIVIDEVPAAAAAPGIRTLLRISAPVFVAPAAPQPSFAWRLLRRAGSLFLVADNRGNLHEKLRSVVLKTSSGAPAWSTGLSYVLPGQAREWPLGGVAVEAGHLQMSVETESGSHEETLPVVPE